MNKLLGGTLLLATALVAAPAGADDDDTDAVTIFKAKTVAAAYAKYGQACPRFFGPPVPSHIGRHLGSGRLPTGARLSQPTYMGSLAQRLVRARPDGTSRDHRQMAPVSVGWRPVSAGQAGDSLQFCRVGPATLGTWLRAAKGPGASARAVASPYSPQPYTYKPVTYRPYGLDPSTR